MNIFNWFSKDEQPETAKGLKPSPKDERDFALSDQIPAIKRYPKEKPCPFDLSIHDQMLSPSCVGHSSGTLKEGYERKERVKRKFDGEWIYDECKKIDGYDGDGTYLRTGLKVLQKEGAKPVEKDEDPSKYQIAAYARVDELSFEGLKKALSVYNFVLAGYKGSNKGWRDEVIRPPKEGEDTWHHAVALIGYEEDYLIGQNSWGDHSWVHNDSGGTFKVPKDYLPFEAWVILLDKPNEPKQIKDEIEGYVASEYTTIKDGNLVTTHNLRLREKPTTNSAIIKVLGKGTEIKSNMEEVESDGYHWIPVLTQK